jgi:phosphoribosylanthranilate isomerase
VSTRVKFCGITRPADAELAVSLDAWAIGMILWPASPRALSPDLAAGIAADVRRKVEIVGVFVNPTLDEVAEMADLIGLTIVQLHGQEGPVFCAEVARRTGCRIIKAARVRGRADIQALAPFHTDFHLLDGYRAGQPGGTGQTFVWELVAGRRSGVPLILSGGLTAGNVAQAIRTLGPYAVDVASGTEASPGVKDPARMREFAAAVTEAAAVGSPS